MSRLDASTTLTRVLQIVAFLLPTMASGQQLLRGVVTDLRFGGPVPDALVEVIRQADLGRAEIVASGRTDSAGKVTVIVSAGTYRVRVRRIAYQPSETGTITVRSTPADFEIHLREIVQTLDSVKIQAAVGGVLFENRRKLMVGGTILTAPELREKGFTTFRTVALGIAGLHIVNGQIRTRASRTSPCRGPLYLRDGVRFRVSQSEIESIPFDQISAIEIYQNVASTPSEYAGLSTCGVIVVWTVRPPLI